MASNSSSGGHHSFTSRRILDHGDWFEVPTCKCGKPMVILTSWTKKNPGRRFWICVGKGIHKCESWQWAEPELCDRAKKIIPGLLDNINEKDEEIKYLTMSMKQSQRKRIAPFLCGLGLGIVVHIAMYVLLM